MDPDQAKNVRRIFDLYAYTFKTKNAELIRHMDEVKLKMEISDRSEAEKMEEAERVFELSQTLETRWVEGDYRAKREILEFLCSNFTLDGVSPCIEINKPLLHLTKGARSNDGGEGGIRTRGTGVTRTTI